MRTWSQRVRVIVETGACLMVVHIILRIMIADGECRFANQIANDVTIAGGRLLQHCNEFIGGVCHPFEMSARQAREIFREDFPLS